MIKRILTLISIDILCVISSLYISFMIRFDFKMPNEFLPIFISWLPLFIIVQVIVFSSTGLYQRIWRFTSLFDLFAILKSIFISSSITFLTILFLSGTEGYPRSILILHAILITSFVCVSRVAVRVYFSHFMRKSKIENIESKKRLILIGAGRTGEKIAREIINSPSVPFEIIGFIDDDSKKKGQMIHGHKILGNIKDLEKLDYIFDELLICTPTASIDQMRQIINSCKSTGKKYKTVPTLVESINKDITLASIRDVSYVDLLGRDEVKLDLQSITYLLNQKRILITGAGGSIGSELVKQCLNFKPSEIICVDINEEKIFNLGLQNSKLSNQVIIKPVLANINIKNELHKVFNENRPQIVFHAAAYKHVPIQEISSWSAVDTNIGGTLNMLELSDKFKIDKFVLVSTDKAVNPVNIMGATKRVAEKLLQSYNQISKTNFMAVRFGNVLGSSGSAIPIFQKQINKGGPVTITHPEMTRYFMSIPEATQLIVQCASLGKDGEIFLLDMGKPIKITNIAKDLIKLSGFEPERDIPIVYTGLRAGEKLYEELQHISERKIFTKHNKITILKDGKSIIPWSVLLKSVNNLLKISKDLETDKIQLYLKKLLPTYQPRKSLFDEKREPDINSYIIKAEA